MVAPRDRQEGLQRQGAELSQNISPTENLSGGSGGDTPSHGHGDLAPGHSLCQATWVMRGRPGT